MQFVGVLVRLPSPAHRPLSKREGAWPKIGGNFFYRYLIVCFVSEIVWWGKENVKQIREAFLSAERVSHAPGACDSQNCLHSLSLELAPQFPGADNCSYKQTGKNKFVNFRTTKQEQATT